MIERQQSSFNPIGAAALGVGSVLILFGSLMLIYVVMIVLGILMNPEEAKLVQWISQAAGVEQARSVESGSAPAQTGPAEPQAMGGDADGVASEPGSSPEPGEEADTEAELVMGGHFGDQTFEIRSSRELQYFLFAILGLMLVSLLARVLGTLLTTGVGLLKLSAKMGKELSSPARSGGSEGLYRGPDS